MKVRIALVAVALCFASFSAAADVLIAQWVEVRGASPGGCGGGMFEMKTFKLDSGGTYTTERFVGEVPLTLECQGMIN